VDLFDLVGVRVFGDLTRKTGIGNRELGSSERRQKRRFGLGGGMGGEAGFSAPQPAKARVAPVEMTILLAVERRTSSGNGGGFTVSFAPIA
jgi:hypothetical protein